MRLIDADELLDEIVERMILFRALGKERVVQNYDFAATVVGDAPTVDAVPVVRCRECKFWMPEHIERDDGSIMLYEQLPRMEPGMAPIEFGVNVGSYCTLCENVVTHGFRDGNPCLDCTRLWRREDDYCSRGQRRGQSADVRNMGQFAGDGKTGGPNDADQH